MGLPAIILTGVLLFVGNYPLGNNNFALWDMDYQYLDFFQWLKRVVNGEANIAIFIWKILRRQYHRTVVILFIKSL